MVLSLVGKYQQSPEIIKLYLVLSKKEYQIKRKPVDTPPMISWSSDFDKNRGPIETPNIKKISIKTWVFK